MKFKTEVCLLSLAIALFVVSAFFYTYQMGTGSFSVFWTAFSYRGLALAFVGCGSVLTVTASVSFSKHDKELLSQV
jgi:hypothetical protein